MLVTLRRVALGMLAVALAAVTFVVGLYIGAIAVDVSGCPWLIDDERFCKSGWESEASWVIGVVAYAVMIGGPLLSLVGVPFVATRRHRRRGECRP
jgi:hypothetical protein